MEIKIRTNVSLLLIIVVLACVGSTTGQSTIRFLNMTTRELSDEHSDDMTDTQVREIQDAISANVERLRSEGKLPLMMPVDPVTFAWPVAKASGQREFNIGLVSDFVDHDPAFPGQVLDWNCGTRTYDQDNGNNHRGIDIISHPFVWKRMYQNEQYAVAAAAGVIVFKQDGMFDQNCSNPGPTGNWNAVYLMHSDGSVTWYGHLKNGSLTAKGIGESVASGEYLGVTGSSGSSLRPHLHFQVYDAAGQLNDPYQGACNSMNNFSWWTVQEPYRNSQILALTTGSAIPQFPTCPLQEVTNEKIVFQPGDTLVTSAYYRDQLAGQETQHTIIRPDGTAFSSWTHVSPQTYNFLRFWSWNWQIPKNPQMGEWTYRADYNGQTYEVRFYVGQPPNVSVMGRVTTLTGRPVLGATVKMSRAGSPTRSSRTNAFGYYQFSDVPVGETFDVNIAAKGLTFLPRSILISGELTAFDHFSLNDY